MIYKRYCIKCGEIFRPQGRKQKLCNNCRTKVRNVNFINMLSLRKLRKENERG
jgi:uncharacterized OB-fold protein